MAYAQHQFNLSVKQGDGCTLREHYRAYEQRNGRPHPSLLDAPQLPDGLGYLWTDFLELHGSRGSSGMGAAPITFADIDAWQRVTGKDLSPWELDAIRGADGAFFKSREKANA